jgi:regulator of PEP synthase PpsR (kinase-PPPase family)
MGSQKKERYVFIVSDATGSTCQMVVQSALTQFVNTEVYQKIVPNVTSAEKIKAVIKSAAEVNGVVIYTMVQPELRRMVTHYGRSYGVSTVDILGPILSRLSDLLEISPMAKPGIFKQLDADYIKRMNAIDFSIKHDDSLRLDSLKDAEIIIFGVSRTGKTPISMYLAYRGWKVANIPVVYNQPLPEEIHYLPPNIIVGLTVHPSRLQLLRLERQGKLGCDDSIEYIDPLDIRKEVSYALKIFQTHQWPVFDVTYKSIEESSTEIMRSIYSRSGNKKGDI